MSGQYLCCGQYVVHDKRATPIGLNYSQATSNGSLVKSKRSDLSCLTLEMFSTLNNSDPRKWVYHTQTEKKHKILKSYLDAWYPILGSRHGRLVVVDGFAGRASYTPREGMSTDDEIDGSPLIMLKSLIEHKFFTNGKLNNFNEFIFIFIERNEENHAALESALDAFKTKYQPWPSNVKTYVNRCKFEDVNANGISEYVLEPQLHPRPQATFLFVDPFGFTGYTMELLKQICRPRHGHVVELFLNFMGSFILSSAIKDSQISNMSRLFGMDAEEWIRYRDGEFRENPTSENLVDLFRLRLKERVGFNYILSLEMRRQNETTIYFLIYATRHWRGVDCMKNAMWKHDPEASERLCSRSDSLDLILMDHFKTKRPDAPLSVEEVKKHVVLETPFKISHMREALKALERKGCIDVILIGRERRKETYPSDSVIIFKSAGQSRSAIEGSITPKKSPIRKQSTGPIRKQIPSPNPSQSLLTKFFSSSKATYDGSKKADKVGHGDNI